jgi:hypothetical protein
LAEQSVADKFVIAPFGEQAAGGLPEAALACIQNASDHPSRLDAVFMGEGEKEVRILVGVECSLQFPPDPRRRVGSHLCPKEQADEALAVVGCKPSPHEGQLAFEVQRLPSPHLQRNQGFDELQQALRFNLAQSGSKKVPVVAMLGVVKTHGRIEESPCNVACRGRDRPIAYQAYEEGPEQQEAGFWGTVVETLNEPLKVLGRKIFPLE